MIKYKKNNFKLKELANILYNYYRDLIDIYCGFQYDIDDDDTEMTDEYINRKNYDQIKIMASKPIGNHCKHLDLYEMSDIIEFKEKETRALDIFMIRNKNFEPSKNKKLLIKFVLILISH
eukprot:86487_1